MARQRLEHAFLGQAKSLQLQHSCRACHEPAHLSSAESSCAAALRRGSTATLCKVSCAAALRRGSTATLCKVAAAVQELSRSLLSCCTAHGTQHRDTTLSHQVLQLVWHTAQPCNEQADGQLQAGSCVWLQPRAALHSICRGRTLSSTQQLGCLHTCSPVPVHYAACCWPTVCSTKFSLCIPKPLPATSRNAPDQIWSAPTAAAFCGPASHWADRLFSHAALQMVTSIAHSPGCQRQGRA